MNRRAFLRRIAATAASMILAPIAFAPLREVFKVKRYVYGIGGLDITITQWETLGGMDLSYTTLDELILQRAVTKSQEAMEKKVIAACGIKHTVRS